MSDDVQRPDREYFKARISGNHSEADRLRAEYFNKLAGDMKKKNDLLGLNLLAALDEAERKGLNGLAAHLSILNTIYNPEDPSILSDFCRIYSDVDRTVADKFLHDAMSAMGNLAR